MTRGLSAVLSLAHASSPPSFLTTPGAAPAVLRDHAVAGSAR
jgi:hypothetical protein